jgi:two-component system response regulator GlrR
MKKKLLLVDDNENFIQLLKIALQDEDYEVDTANSGLSALSTMERTSYDWLISDIRMEELDGIGLAKKVKEQFPRTKIILMTAFEVAERIEELEVEGFLEKPVRVEDLCKIINTFPK